MENVEDIYPLSPLQAGMLFHAVTDERAGMYVEQLAVRLDGAFDVDAFADAWRQVIARHPALRTSFLWEGLDRPVQVVHREVELDAVVHDWRGLPETEREARLTEFLHEDHASGFDLTRAPLIRITVIRLTDETCELICGNHHIIFDGWSRAIVFREVMAIYNARGDVTELPPARPYRDYIAWLQQQDSRTAEEVWRETLADFTTPTPLPVGGTEATGDGSGSVSCELSEETTAWLHALTRDHGITLGTVVQGLWGVLLGRHAGVRDVVFGVTVAGRPAGLAGVEQMVGLFINTLPVRVCWDADSVAAAWLGGLQGLLAGLRDLEHSSLTDVQGWSQVPRGQRLFDSLVVFENYPVGPRAVEAPGDLVVSGMRAGERTDAALTLVAVPGRRLGLRLLFETARYDATTARGLLEQMRVLLAGVSADPGGRVDELALSSPQVAAAQIQACNPGPVAAADPVPLIERFVECARRCPDAVAVVSGDAQLTYGEVYRRAAGLAGRLGEVGVGPETLVGVLLGRGPDQVVAVLATHLAGGAYLPLDPGYPSARLHHLLTDSRTTTVITTPDLHHLLPSTDLTTITPTHPADQVAQVDPVVVDGAQMAYVIYTSGSTGRPKGVAVGHRQAARLFDVTAPWLQAGERDVWTLFHSLAFDFSVWELWGALAHGGRLVIVEEDTRRSPTDMTDLLRAQAVTILNQTPSAFFPLTDHLLQTGQRLPDLRMVIFGGEALPTTRLKDWFTTIGADRPHLVNMYGITETTVHVTHHHLSPGDLTHTGGSPIGRPLKDLRLYLLDSQLRPVPPTTSGQIHVGGAGPARGYLHRPALTAERFIPDPYSPVPGARLYRTGDLAHTDRNGALTYTRRADHQIQLRGHRIEPGEIETTLRTHPGVKDAIITVHQPSTGDQRLTAYITTTSPLSPAQLRDQLRRHCTTHLPPHMIPAHYIHLDHLPLTPHGKIDHTRLPPPEPITTNIPHDPPQTPTEHTLTHIWQHTLSHPHINRHDNFFTLGGHSLTAARLQSRIRSTFGVDVPLRTIFETADLEALAQEITRLGAAQSSPTAPIPSTDSAGPLPLSPAQRRLWFLEQWEPATPLYHIAGSLKLTGFLDDDALRRSCQVTMDRHDALRIRLVSDEMEPRQEILPRRAAPFSVVDLSPLDPAVRQRAAERLAQRAAETPFALSAGPLWRAVLIRLTPTEHLLALCMHHLIGDGQSLGVLLRELSAGYDRATRGLPVAVEPPPMRYGHYVAWQLARSGSEQVAADLAYWHRRLAGLNGRLLPTDMPRPAVQTHASAIHQVELPSAVAAGLPTLAEQAGVTPFMALFSATALALAQTRELRDVVVGTAVANRSRPELEGLIGCLVNTVVLRLEVPAAETFAELLAQARTVCTDAYAHAEVPFERVVQEVQPERSAGHLPLFQTWFVVQEEQELDGTFADLEVVPVGTPPRMARYDLRLEFRRAPAALTLVCEYKTDLFAAASIARLTEHVARVLETVIADPGTSRDDLARLLAEADARRRLRETAAAEGYSAGALQRHRRRRA